MREPNGSVAVMRAGLLIEHTLWGRGKVLAATPAHMVAYFPSLVGTAQGPERKLQLGAAQVAIAAVQSDPRLDRVASTRPATRRAARAPRARPAAGSLEQTIEWFSGQYPGLFSDAKLAVEELDYKRAASALFRTRFGEGRGEQLLAAGNLAAIAAALEELYHATNIPSRYEVIAVHDGLRDHAAAGRLLAAVLSFIQTADAPAFDALVEAVGGLPGRADGSRVLTWPNLTILPFLADPGRFMVLKPVSAERLAARVGLDLQYSPDPRWHTYAAVQELGHVVLGRLAPLGARDLIDVQSFMWVTRDCP